MVDPLVSPFIESSTAPIKSTIDSIESAVHAVVDPILSDPRVKEVEGKVVEIEQQLERSWSDISDALFPAKDKISGGDDDNVEMSEQSKLTVPEPPKDSRSFRLNVQEIAEKVKSESQAIFDSKYSIDGTSSRSAPHRQEVVRKVSKEEFRKLKQSGERNSAGVSKETAADPVEDVLVSIGATSKDPAMKRFKGSISLKVDTSAWA